MYARFCSKFLLIMCLIMPSVVMAQADPYQAPFEELTHNLRCMTCPNETIAESNSPMAQDVKLYIAQHLVMGDSKDQIVDALTKRYGDAIRYKPPVNGQTALLWLTPLICLIAGIAIVLIVLSKKQRKTL